MVKVHLFLGAPGCGKGTLSKLVAEKYHLTHLSTGDILRDLVFKETELGHRIKDSLADGKLVDDSTVNEVVFARLQDEASPVLFDGYPRTLNQATALDDFLSERGFGLGLVVYIAVPMSALEDRIVGRRVCSNGACGAIYHTSRKKPVVDGVCDSCKSPLKHRSDDTPEVFKARMEVFNTFYEPVLHYYSSKSNFRQIDGAGLPDEAFRAISKLYEE